MLIFTLKNLESLYNYKKYIIVKKENAIKQFGKD